MLIPRAMAGAHSRSVQVYRKPPAGSAFQQALRFSKGISVKIGHLMRRGKLRLFILVLAAAAVALIIPLSQVASARTAVSARTAAPARASGPKPTIVLEHGAWADSGSWDAVIQRLQADGYTVYASPNPLQG